MASSTTKLSFSFYLLTSFNFPPIYTHTLLTFLFNSFHVFVSQSLSLSLSFYRYEKRRIQPSLSKAVEKNRFSDTETESDLPVISKRVWSMIRVIFFMLRKGITKGKLMMDLNLMLKRHGKLAGKAIANLMSHHHNSSSAASHEAPLQFSTAREYEFSCSNTPNYSFFSKRHPRHNHSHFFACAHAPLTLDDDAVAVNNALQVALETLDDKKHQDVMEASPALLGFGRTPTVRQLRVTDSPFPVQDGNDDRDHQVDKAAEEFIKRFYKELRKQG